MTQYTVGVITNPNSRKNRNRRERPGRGGRAGTLQAIVGEGGRVLETPAPEAIAPALRAFLRAGARIWVSDGGDGALNWMLRAALDVLDEPEFAGCGLPMVLPTNGGTIDFVAKTAGVVGDAPRLLAALRDLVARDAPIPSVELDTLAIEGVRRTAAGEAPFRSIGFAAAAGGVGQHFFAKYYASDDPRPFDIVRVIARTLVAAPFALTPLGRLDPRLGRYAADLFEPTQARVTVDGEVFPTTACTCIHVASIPINLGGVVRVFRGAAEPGRLHAIYGAPTPLGIIRNLPRVVIGATPRGGGLVDGPCAEMTVEATTNEDLAPVVDGEYDRGVRRVTFRLGPPVRVVRLNTVGGSRLAT